MYSAVGPQRERSRVAACNESTSSRSSAGLLQDFRVAYFFDPESVRKSMRDVGVCLVNGVLDQDRVQELRSAFPENVHGVRNLLDRQIIRELACSEPVRRLAVAVLGERCFAVRGIFFDKPAEANWKLPFHQDLTISVQSRKDAPGFDGWTVKGGVQHVQPPTEILERMASARLYLDDSRSDNGPLRVFRGSHGNGRLTEQQIEEIVREETAVECRVPVGGALIMKPLIVHGSSASPSPAHRRVIRLDYVGEDLPYGLEWQQRVYTA